ncbi:MAG: MFS family permease [Crocinitomicaceae bacterium]|jgi:MFS family permease
MCWALLFFMVSFNLFIPEMNDFLSKMGGENLKGMNFVLFSLAALMARPFSGKLSDTIGRKKVMYLGVVIGIVVTVIYPFTSVAFAFLSLRFFHGFSAGFLPTGATALVTDLIPVKGRGVAMGIWGTFISVGFGVGNFFSGMITSVVGLVGLYMIAAFFCLLAGIIILQLKETLPNPQRFKWSMLKVTMRDVFEPTVRPAAFVMFCSAVSTGVVFVTSPDISGFHGIENKGWFFLFYMSSTILIRLFASSMSDRIGRRKALIIGLSFMVISMTLIAFSREWIQYTIGAIVFGMSTGVSSPTIFAWLADLSPVERRGVGAGTVFIALEFAIMGGALITLMLYDNTVSSIPVIYLIAACFSIMAIIYLIWHLRTQESKT